MRFGNIRARVALTLSNVAHKIAAPGRIKRAGTLSGVDDSRGWSTLFSTFGGIFRNFQTGDVEVRQDSVLSNPTMFACITLIAGDGGKLRAMLMEQIGEVWKETSSPAFSPVLRKPNHYQTWQQFIECWLNSKMTRGNTYVLKGRDNRGVVRALYVLDPCRCHPLVSSFDGSVYYALGVDDLSTVSEARDGINAVPASEIIHDRFNCLFHPLVGLSPIFAAGVCATKANTIDSYAAKFFKNSSRPGGILTAPGEISDDTAKRLKEYFETNFSGDNAGKVAVLGDALKYEMLAATAVDSQLIEQMEWSAKQVAAVFHVPGYLVGAEPVPANNNIEALRLDYYQRCLQALLEAIENLLDAGLGIGIGDPKDGKTYGIELDLSGLFRMDTKTLADVENIKVQRGLSTINEGRRKFNNPPVEGGDVPMLQEQNWPLKLLAERKLPAETPPPAPTPPPTPTADGEDPAPAEAAAAKAAAEAARADVASMRAALDGQATGLQRFMDSLPALMAAEVAKAAPAPAIQVPMLMVWPEKFMT